MRLIQWHLKNNWRVPESLEKVVPIHRSLQPHLKWWFQEENVLQGKPLHPLNNALQIYTLSESKLHINYLELKAVSLVLKEFHILNSNSIFIALNHHLRTDSRGTKQKKQRTIIINLRHRISATERNPEKRKLGWICLCKEKRGFELLSE